MNHERNPHRNGNNDNGHFIVFKFIHLPFTHIANPLCLLMNNTHTPCGMHLKSNSIRTNTGHSL